MKDVVIIGSGPAGLSAALYILRGGFSVSVVGADQSSLKKAEKIENYFGLEHPVSGNELIEIGKRQVLSLGGELIEDEVVGISWDEDFTVAASHNSIETKAIIIATGSPRNRVILPNLPELEGKGVSYCAVCDAFFYREKDAAVLGNGEYALHEVQELLPIVRHVILLTNGLEPTTLFPDEVTIITKPIEALIGTEQLEGVSFIDSTFLPISGLFVALGTAKGSDLAKKLGLPLNNDKILVDDGMSTPLPGVFAAGDCIGGILQVSTAVGEGAKAALSAIKFLRSKNT